jgi:transcriptional regulator with XRE-family HTH domain
MSDVVVPIPKRELLAYRADFKGSIFRQIREMFARLKETGFTQKELAEKIDMDKGHLSRRLRGDYDLQLETLSDLARGLNCRIDVRLTPLSDVLPIEPRVTPVSNDSDFAGKLGLQPLPSDGAAPPNDNSPQARGLAS